MRGTLGKMPGVLGVDIKVGEDQFTVSYDPAKVKPEAMVEPLKTAGETKVKLLPS